MVVAVQLSSLLQKEEGVHYDMCDVGDGLECDMHRCTHMYIDCITSYIFEHERERERERAVVFTCGPHQ